MLKYFLFTPIAATILVLTGATSPATPRVPQRPGGTPKQTEEKKVAEVGEKAPAFALKDQHGTMHKLADYEGKVVVLEWFNELCPYCKKVWDSGLVGKINADLREMDTEVVYFAMNSTANRPEDEILESGAEYIKDAKLEISMLMDYNGKIGRAYGARTTPHIFIIDTEGILVYQGAICDDKRVKKGSDSDNHIIRVVSQLSAGEEVSPNYVQPWGCSVKYARGQKEHPDHPDRQRRQQPPRKP
jgi:peroxiredoxin